MDVWIGFIEGTNEYLTATKNGIVKCSSVRRLDEVGNFDKELIDKIRVHHGNLYLVGIHFKYRQISKKMDA